MNELQVLLFGKFSVLLAGQELADLRATKAQELLSYLLLHPERAHHREALADILWEDASTTRSKRYLRRVLWQLHSALSAWTARSNNPILVLQGDWIQFNPQSPIWVDVLCFEQCCTRLQGTSGQYLDAENVQRLQDVVQLYRGDLLEGWYQEWCLFERERLQRLLLSALSKLMQYCEAYGKYETGIEYGMCALRYDPARENIHRQLMRLYYLAGDRTGALHQYEQCVAVLEEELAIRPAQPTEILYEHIRLAQSTLSIPRDDADPPAQADPLLLQKLHGELQQIRGFLDSVQQQVQQQIEMVESALRQRSR